jgi:hypothetical protein
MGIIVQEKLNDFDLETVVDENKELKDRVRRTDAVLRSMHVSATFTYK